MNDPKQYARQPTLDEATFTDADLRRLVELARLPVWKVLEAVMGRMQSQSIGILTARDTSPSDTQYERGRLGALAELAAVVERDAEAMLAARARKATGEDRARRTEDSP